MRIFQKLEEKLFKTGNAQQACSCSEEVTSGVLYKVSQVSQESTCVGASF